MSIVSDRDVQGESKKVGDECTIVINKKEYRGKIAAKGTMYSNCITMQEDLCKCGGFL